MPTSNYTFDYKDPHPHNIPKVFFRQDTIFVGPLEFLNQFVPLTPIPRETLHYSAIIIEDIMDAINLEFEARGRTKPTWKAYKAGIDNFITFTPSPKNGKNISRVPVKYFPQIVRDIQLAIEALITDTKYPDDKGSYFARIFANRTIHTAHNFWSAANILQNGYVVPATNAQKEQTLNPLTRIIGVGADWPFPVNPAEYTGEGHVENPLARMGVDFKGIQHIRNQANNGIETSATDFPASVIGKRRTEQNVAIVNGQIVPKPGSNINGIDGIDIPMRPEGRPGPHSRSHQQDTSTGYGEGGVDVDAGYTFLAHHPLIIQQLRYQPPIIEKFDGPQTVPNEHYTQRIYSNTTVNIPYIFAHPVERKFRFNWENWLIRGRASSAADGLTLISPPDQYAGMIVTNCPFSVFYPGSTSNCTCSAADSAYAVWGAGGLGEVLVWEDTFLNQSGAPASLYKRIGPKTRLRVKNTFGAAGGSPNHRYYYSVSIRINSIAGPNLQPFIPIYVDPGSNPDSTLTNFLSVMTLPLETHSDGSKSVNITDAIKKSYPQNPGNGDFIVAMGIFVHQQVSGSKVCGTIDVSGGTIVDPACPPTLVCTMGTASSKTNYIMLYEPPLSGTDDVRLST